MMGHNMEKKHRDDPQLLHMWDTYQDCRQLTITIYEKPTGKKDGSKILSVLTWPTGYAHLPAPGGVADQDYLTMRYFRGFMSGEREAAGKLLSRRGK